MRHSLPSRPRARYAALALLLAAGLLGACGDGASEPPTTPPVASGQLIVQLSGLPRNAAVPAEAETLRRAGFAVRLRGPGGLDTALLASTTLRGLAAGTYSLVSTGAVLDSVAYIAAPDSLGLTLAGNTTRVAEVSFAATTGGLDVRAAGVPEAGVPSDGAVPLRATLQYPDGRIDSLVLPARRLLLAPGRYLLTAAPAERGGALYAPGRALDTVDVTASALPQVRTISYESRLASLAVAVSGVPVPDRLGFLTLVSPDGGERTVRASPDTVLFGNLLAGRYRLRAAPFAVATAQYTPLIAEDTITVAAGTTATGTLSYRRTTASLAVQASGVPDGWLATVRVTGPASFDSVLTAPARLTELAPGSYTLTAQAFVAPAGGGLRTFAAAQSTRTAVVAFGDTTATGFAYGITTGGLAVTVEGLPDSIAAQVRVTRSAGDSTPGFPWLVPASGVRHNIPPGRYALTASAIVLGDSLFVPTPVQREVMVRAGAASDSVTVSYTGSEGPSLDFAITGAYITQAVQRFDGGVPLVANRDALLRVFVQANEGNSERLTVRVRLLQDTLVYRTFNLPSPGASAPLTVSEGTLAQSWNVPIGGGDVREGMRLVVDFGEAPGVSDADPSNNRWPVSGVQAVDVRTVPPFSLVLVPIEHPIDSLTGAVSSDTAPAFTNLTQELMPLQQMSVSVHDPFPTSAMTLQPDDANKGWTTVLSEMDALRLLESAGSTHYMGIVGTTYAGGIAGIASIRGRTAVSWDRLPGAARIVAHELGHNFGRFHSAGCGAQFIDANYPYPGGATGAWGWNGSMLLSPTSTNDIMGYCSTQWISDYTWTGVLDFRSVNSAVAPSWLGARRDSVLVVWGAVHGDSAVLAPAVRVVANTEWPAVGSGRYALDLLDAQGGVLRTVRFDGTPLDHREDVETFAFALPTGLADREAVTMQLRRGGVVLASQRARSAGAVPGRAATATMARLSRRSALTAALQWDSATWPLAVVRDAGTGEVLAITRRTGEMLRVNGARSLEVILSDGVRSVTRRLPAP